MTIETDPTITIKIIITIINIINKRFICLNKMIVSIIVIDCPVVIFWLYVFGEFWLFIMIVVVNVVIMALIIIKLLLLVFIASTSSILFAGCLLKSIDVIVIVIILIVEIVDVIVEHCTHAT